MSFSDLSHLKWERVSRSTGSRGSGPLCQKGWPLGGVPTGVTLTTRTGHLWTASYKVKFKVNLNPRSSSRSRRRLSVRKRRGGEKKGGGGGGLMMCGV